MAVAEPVKSASSSPQTAEAQSLCQKLPTWLFVVAVGIGFPYILYAGDGQWFYLDDFDFLAARRLESFSSLMQPHFGHWSTLPIVEYRTLYSIFGLKEYWPYQVVAILGHLVVAVLLYRVMRRAKVDPWIATAAGILFLFLGSGWVDILWSFQIGFTGAMAFGLAFLLLVDRPPANRRRNDVLGMVCGLAALLCSGVGVAAIVAVGAALLLRRGWRAAIIIVGPLALIFLTWFVTYGRQGSPATRATFTQIRTFLWAILTNPFSQLLHIYGLGWLVAAVLLVGIIVAAVSMSGPQLRDRYSATAGLLMGGLVFAALTTLTRAQYVTTSNDSEARASRYLYIGIAFLLPAVAAAASVLVRHRPTLVGITVALLLLGFVENVRQLHPSPATTGDPAVIMAIAESPLLPYAQATQSFYYVSVGWIRGAAAAGKLPTALPISADERAGAAMELTFDLAHAGSACHALSPNGEVDLRAGQEIDFPAGVTMITLLEHGRAIATGPYSVRTLDGVHYLKDKIPSIAVRLQSQGHGGAIHICAR